MPRGIKTVNTNIEINSASKELEQNTITSACIAGKQDPQCQNDFPNLNKFKFERKPHVKIQYEKPATNEDLKGIWVPYNWTEFLTNLRIMRANHDAPVDSMGCHKTCDENASPEVVRYQTLIALMLSSQTKDQVTFAAMERLRERGLSVDGVLNMSDEDLGQLIYPVGFWKTKVKYIKKTTQTLKEQYNGDIPDSVDKLCKLSGVGPKMAHLCMSIAWNKVTGIGVDTHVHRISNRIGWVKKPTNTPEDTRKALESWLPFELWNEVNHLMVGFGQTICLPIGPNCGECLNKDICPSSGKLKKSPMKKSPAKQSAGTSPMKKSPMKNLAGTVSSEFGNVSTERPKSPTNRIVIPKIKLETCDSNIQNYVENGSQVINVNVSVKSPKINTLQPEIKVEYVMSEETNTSPFHTKISPLKKVKSVDDQMTKNIKNELLHKTKSPRNVKVSSEKDQEESYGVTVKKRTSVKRKVTPKKENLEIEGTNKNITKEVGKIKFPAKRVVTPKKEKHEIEEAKESVKTKTPVKRKVTPKKRMLDEDQSVENVAEVTVKKRTPVKEIVTQNKEISNNDLKFVQSKDIISKEKKTKTKSIQKVSPVRKSPRNRSSDGGTCVQLNINIG